MRAVTAVPAARSTWALGVTMKGSLPPALDTANKSIDSYNKTFRASFGPNGAADLTDISKTIDDVNKQVQREIRKSFKAAKTEGNPKRLIKCIQRAHGNVQKMQRCTVKF